MRDTAVLAEYPRLDPSGTSVGIVESIDARSPTGADELLVRARGDVGWAARHRFARVHAWR